MSCTEASDSDDGLNIVNVVNILRHISLSTSSELKLTRGRLEVEGHKRLKASEVIHNSTCRRRNTT